MALIELKDMQFLLLLEIQLKRGGWNIMGTSKKIQINEKVQELEYHKNKITEIEKELEELKK